MKDENLYNALKCIVEDVGKSYEGNYRTRLKIILKKYENLVCGNDFEIENIEQISDSVKGTIIILKEIVDAQYKGLHSTAYRKLYNLFKKLRKHLLYKKISKKSFLFRMRVFAPEKRRHVQEKDLFHIPLNMRGIVTTQRYSVPGLPCLYMGESIYACWEEMKRPQLNLCMTSKLQCQDEIKLLNLAFFQDNDEEWWNDNIEKVLNIFPILLSCMIPVADEDAIYKPEYIIPQLVMEWVIWNRKKEKIYGIYYTSANVNEDFDYPLYKLNNLAIPVIDISRDKEYCPVLCEMFKITKPLCIEFEKLKGANDDYGQYGVEDEKEENYRISDFSYLESRFEDNYESIINED